MLEKIKVVVENGTPRCPVCCEANIRGIGKDSCHCGICGTPLVVEVLKKDGEDTSNHV